MEYSYAYMHAHILEPEEAVDEYYTNKNKYLNGEKTFSNGDYYNLFATITDSVELDTITVLAHKEITSHKDYHLDRISPYVCYRMERLNQRNGIADTMALKPFIDETKGIEVVKFYGDIKTRINRRDIIATQALGYYQMQNFYKAQQYIDWLKQSGKLPEGVDKLEYFMNLRKLYPLDRKSMTAEQLSLLNNAIKFALNSSNDNKAILYTECPELQKDKSETEKWIDIMDDNNPKKWYLKGLLWTDKTPEQEDEFFSSEIEDTTAGFRILSAAEEESLMLRNDGSYAKYIEEKAKYKQSHKSNNEDSDINVDINTDNIKPYLAYFNHAFELQPKFKRYYFEEGKVNEEMRKKYPFKKKDIPAYREVFKTMKRIDDYNRRIIMEEMELFDNEE